MSPLMNSLKSSRPRDPLHEYQHRAVEHILAHPSCALWLDMGLGKTLAAATAVSTLLEQGHIQRVLIIAPLRVAKSTWPAELGKWAHLRHLTYSIIAGTPANRRQQANKDAQIHIINYENAQWLADEYGNDWQWDMVIADESSRLKNISSKRVKALRKIRKHVKRWVNLTGSPAPNGLMDLYSQTWFLDGGARLGKSFWQFRGRYFYQSGYGGYTYVPHEHSQKAIQNKLKDICLSMKSKDYLELPDRIDNTLLVDLPAPVDQIYEEIQADMFIALDNLAEVTAVNAAALTMKCRQICNGAVYTDTPGEWKALHNAKLDALDEVIEESAGQPVLVFYQFVSDRDRIMKRFPQAQVLDKNPEMLDAWNRQQIPLLLAHPASAGHGLNMQDGGNIMVWFGLDWNLELYEQACARLHRQGQDKPVIIHHILARGTVEDDILTRLQTKASVQEVLMQAMKRKAA